MLLAGLYDTVRYIDSDPSSPPIKTFTILTTTPSKSLGWLHDRMPCVLESEEDCVRWLDCRNGWTGEVAKLLRPYEGEVECYPVPPEVGKVGTNSPSFVVPVKERKDGIANFFKKQTNAEGGSSVPALSGKALKREHEQDDVGAEKREGKRPRKAEEHDVVQPADDAQSEKKTKTDAEAVDEKVHSPVPSNTINTSEANDAKPTSSKADEKSQKAKNEEEEFEMQIGDDSNAPNPTSGGSAQKGKAQPRARSEVRPATGSKRQTRSSVGETAEKPTTRSTRSGKQSTSVKEEIKDSDDEIQILSSPDAVSGKLKRSVTSSFAPGKQTRTPERKTAKKGGKQAKGIAATAAEDGAENTTKLDGFLKHEESG
ncbi:hypothetical protein QFC22_004604 [Naganishia vaughanmartiniae]|uniref:Uncharacterized protein n=1 Tax=Naganishia vaughanmartiniae TaxID=1424756 RepID=A0ACC2WZX8_9TREE|nr:hypothetical protein QFC22_004604 [Naganishia vaughanmartiniae]